MITKTQGSKRVNSFGLIIQGPISSTGIAGSKFGRGKYSQDINSLVQMDCTENILTLASEGVKCFDSVILSTWDTESSVKLEIRLPKAVKLLKLQDPGGREGKYKGKNLSESVFYSNNKVRQFYGIEKATQLMISKGIEFTVKIRTDQCLDLRLLYSELASYYNDWYVKGFFVPYLLKSVPWAIPDFFIGGESRKLLELSELMQAQFEFHGNVHRDMFFKGSLLWNPGLTLDCMSLLHRREDKINAREARLVSSLLPYWLLGSSQLFDSLRWRGEPVAYEADSLVFNGGNNQQLKMAIEKKYYPLEYKYLIQNIMKIDKRGVLFIIRKKVRRTLLKFIAFLRKVFSRGLR